ncbi:protein arginine N-methyltransferase 1 isoform X2 [Agrilus planipennis]|uniref:type I protein arginine methyltransferase n=1 Tax=Agrilus planipennis TaxID=224129 RepID=A0A1W4WVW7_AGRPL|nr:protein arginine N-methyltransferase 1 isoform X2 [Agrilus planipennis]
MTDNEDLVDIVDAEDEDSDGWNEMEVSGEQTTCLFCPSQFHTIAVALDHCRTEHNFDLLELKNKFSMDCYSYIKMINYIRMHKPSPQILIGSDMALWDDDVYLKPGEMESWLMYDFDDLGSTPSTPHYAIDGKTPIANNFSDLQKQIYELTLQLRHKDMLLKNAMQDMAKMREVTKTIVEGGDCEKNFIPVDVASVPLSCDNTYFSSYSHYGIHYEMLSDKVRTESYRDAILNNKHLFEKKNVLDVGCGTAILSMFANKAGAQEIIGIDQSDIIYKAMDIIRENKLHENIKLIRGRLEDTKLPIEKFDIIISEWMGYFLLFEGMLDSFIYARNRYLKEGGIILPNRCSISLVGCSDKERQQSLIDFWDNVYGFNMKCMKSDVVREAHVETVPHDKIITSSVIINEIDLNTCNTSTVDFTSDFELKVNKSGPLTAFVGYFDTFFDLDNSVFFTTGPHGARTHWQQTVFFLKEPIEVTEGEVLKGQVRCRRMVKNVRGLTVSISVGKQNFEYVLD